MNRKNMIKLAKYLINLPDDYENFNMGQYAVDKDSSFFGYTHLIEPDETKLVKNLPKCGTVACALGHGIEAGIANRMKFDNWEDYCDYYFLNSHLVDRAWDWCFGGGWTRYDNTPKGAGLRIFYLLENGVVPEGFEFAQHSFVKFYENQKEVLV